MTVLAITANIEAPAGPARCFARREDGSVLVTAVILLSVMLSVALASYALADTGQVRSRQQRERETALNLAEGLLHSQSFSLAQRWPGNAALGPSMPISCNQASSDVLCPIPGTLAAANSAIPATANFTNVDARADVTWVAKVRDNGGPLAAAYSIQASDLVQSGTDQRSGGAYSCAAPCRWDANGDRKLWVDARAVVHGRARDVVALMKLETVLEATSEAAVMVGGINIDNNGNKIMVYGQGSQIIVRCPLLSLGCVLAKIGQIQPVAVTVDVPPLMTATQLARFKARAITDGTYFSGCPANEISGAVVWVESCSTAQLSSTIVTQPCDPAAPPSPGGGGTALPQNCVNQYHRPGILIWHCGRMSISGGWTFVGIVYAVNGSDGTCPAGAPPVGNGDCSGNNNNAHNVVSLTGGGGVWGSLAIDGQGCLYAGSNGIQVQFDANVFGAIASYGTVGLVQNTWRELAPK